MEGIRVELPAWAGGKKKKKPTMAESARGRIDRARAVVGNNDAVQGMAQATGMAKNESMCPKLTFQQRLYGVAGCFCTGLVLSFVGFLMWHGGRVDLFAVYYTFGNIVSICSSMCAARPPRTRPAPDGRPPPPPRSCRSAAAAGSSSRRSGRSRACSWRSASGRRAST